MFVVRNTIRDACGKSSISMNTYWLFFIYSSTVLRTTKKVFVTLFVRPWQTTSTTPSTYYSENETQSVPPAILIAVIFDRRSRSRSPNSVCLTLSRFLSLVRASIHNMCFECHAHSHQFTIDSRATEEMTREASWRTNVNGKLIAIIYHPLISIIRTNTKTNEPITKSNYTIWNIVLVAVVVAGDVEREHTRYHANVLCPMRNDTRILLLTRREEETDRWVCETYSIDCCQSEYVAIDCCRDDCREVWKTEVVVYAPEYAIPPSIIYPAHVLLVCECSNRLSSHCWRCHRTISNANRNFTGATRQHNAQCSMLTHERMAGWID